MSIVETKSIPINHDDESDEEYDYETRNKTTRKTLEDSLTGTQIDYIAVHTGYTSRILDKNDKLNASIIFTCSVWGANEPDVVKHHKSDILLYKLIKGTSLSDGIVIFRNKSDDTIKTVERVEQVIKRMQNLNFCGFCCFECLYHADVYHVPILKKNILCVTLDTESG